MERHRPPDVPHPRGETPQPLVRQAARKLLPHPTQRLRRHGLVYRLAPLQVLDLDHVPVTDVRGLCHERLQVQVRIALAPAPNG